MTPSQITRLEKTAVDNGFDRELPRQDNWLAFASTQAPLRIWLTAIDDDRLVLAASQASLNASKNSGGACQRSLDAPEPLARRRIVRESQLGDATGPHEHRGAVEDLEP